MKRGSTLVLSLAFAVGCEAPPSGVPPYHVAPVGRDGGMASLDGSPCAHAQEGCACDGDEPIDCYLEPTVGDRSTTCHAGTRYCRSGSWTACESIEDYTIVTSGAELLTGPDTCNPCDPRCFGFVDVPTGADLEPSNSVDVEYDPDRGGIRPRSTAPNTPALPDADDDGVPDVADDCPGPGAFLAADGSCYGSTFFYHTLAFGGPAVVDSAPIRVQIRTADVYFLMDTTGSMGGELTRLSTDLTSGTFISGCAGGVIGAIRCTIPDAYFGVGFHDDYPYGGYGSPGDIVYRNTLDITASVSAAQAAVNTLTIHGGDDGPESQIPSLWSIATGGGLGSYSSARTGCPAGTFGYPCFRAGTIPIVIHITDAPYHNGPGGSYPYDFGGGSLVLPTPVAVPNTNEARATARNIGVVNGAWQGFSGSTSGMSNDEASGCGSFGAEDAVFRFTVSTTATITISLEGSSYDTVLRVVPVTGGTGWCDNDSVGLQSRIVRMLVAGDYYAVVDGDGGRSGAYQLSIGVPGASAVHVPPTFAETAAALDAAGVRVITVQTCGNWSSSYCLTGESHARALGSASGSLGASGLPYVLRGRSDGSGLSATIVSAVQDLASYSTMDITARPSGDTQGFTQSIAAVSWGPGTCTGISGGTTFVACLPGTTVTFDVSFRNATVPPTAVPQVFSFFIEVIGDGTFVLARIPVRIVVAPTVAGFEPSGIYWHDYDSTTRCLVDERPDWGALGWTADVPPGTDIRIELRSTDQLASIATATPVATVSCTSTGTGTADISGLLRAAGAASDLRYLRAFVTMTSSADLTRAPVLSALTVDYTCIPSE